MFIFIHLCFAKVVDRVVCHDGQHYATWLLELLDKLPHVVCAHNALAFALIAEQSINLGASAVKGDDGKALVSGVGPTILRLLALLGQVECGSVLIDTSSDLTTCLASLLGVLTQQTAT